MLALHCIYIGGDRSLLCWQAREVLQQAFDDGHLIPLPLSSVRQVRLRHQCILLGCFSWEALHNPPHVIEVHLVMEVHQVYLQGFPSAQVSSTVQCFPYGQ